MLSPILCFSDAFVQILILNFQICSMLNTISSNIYFDFVKHLNIIEGCSVATHASFLKREPLFLLQIVKQIILLVDLQIDFY